MSFVTIGTDTELFARQKDGHHVSLCGKIGGTKEEPMSVVGMRSGFALQEDNVAVEFNIPPCNSVTTFVRSIQSMLKVTERTLKIMGLTLSNQVSVSFDKSELTHPKALMFGCEPDYNIWTRRENEKPRSEDKNLRTAGGHIHVGTTGNIVSITQNMDLFLGVPSVLLDDTPESKQRRELYGKAGAMRPKSYGLEYRVLSNFWVFDAKTIKWVFENTVRSCNNEIEYTETAANDIQRCINTGDKALAETLIGKYEISMPGA